MADGSGLTFVFDQDLGLSLLQMLRHARVELIGRINSLEELSYRGGADDEEWMPELGEEGRHAAVTRDRAIIQASIRAYAWRRSGLTFLLLDGQWR